jgi:hypothetical protein
MMNLIRNGKIKIVVQLEATQLFYVVKHFGVNFKEVDLQEAMIQSNHIICKMPMQNQGTAFIGTQFPLPCRKVTPWTYVRDITGH